MPKIAVVYGMENTFPGALVDHINSLGAGGVTAEHLKIGAIRMDLPGEYRVIVDRISHDVPFYRAYLKYAVLNGSLVINNPFWWGADDKFFNYALAQRLGVAVPRTAILPHKAHPPGTTDRSMRNLMYPLNWDEIFAYVGFPAFLKPFSGGGWKNVYHVRNVNEFFRAYDETGDLCMTLQQAIQFEEYYRCYVVGQEKVRVMAYDPRAPHEQRYTTGAPPPAPALLARMENDALTLCRALGYDLNTVEFAVQDGVPYAIDFLNPAPDADYYSVGAANFQWVVEAVADLAVKLAQSGIDPAAELRWRSFLAGPR